MLLEIYYYLTPRRLSQALSSKQGLGPLMWKLILKSPFPTPYKKINSENQVMFKKNNEKVGFCHNLYS